MQLSRDSGRDRSVTKGVEVMADQWRSGKAQVELIKSDVAAYEHFPVQRKKASGGYEDGFLIAGAAAVTFIDQEEKEIISSHPLAFLENYGQDPSIDNLFHYSLKQKHILKKGDLMHFSFMCGSSDVVKKVVNAIDRFSLSGGSGEKEKSGMPKLAPRSPRMSTGDPRNKRVSLGQTKKFDEVWDGKFSDVNNPNETFDTSDKSGMRFVGQQSVVSATAQRGEMFKEEKVPVIAIVNGIGIALLTFKEGKGRIEHFTWPGIKSFGAAGEDCFGFKVTNKENEEVFMCVYTGESAKPMDMLSEKFAKANESLKIESERDRSRTVGVEIMKAGFLGGKSTQDAAIKADIGTFDHIKCQRKKQSSGAMQDGFLVVGTSTITFLSFSKEIVMSHPLGFLETYYIDPEDSKCFNYSIKRKSAIKRGNKLFFSFVIAEEEGATSLLTSLDRYLFSIKSVAGSLSAPGSKSPRASGAVSPRMSGSVSPRIGSQRSSARMSGKGGFAGIWDGTFKDWALPKDAIPTNTVPGVRFIGMRSTLSPTTNMLGPKSMAVAVINDYGVSILQCNSQKGTIESHPWKTIKSFGVAGADIFGFQSVNVKTGDDEYICIVTSDSAGQMDQLAHKHLEQEGIATSEGRARTETRGIEIMSAGWMTEKARNALIDADLAQFEKIPVQRKRVTTEGFEDGFLVIGVTAITFVGPDNGVIASHPLVLLEAYTVDLQSDSTLTYTLKKKKGGGITEEGDPLTFSFKMHSAEQVETAIRNLDRNYFFGTPSGGAPAGAIAPRTSFKKPELKALESVFFDKTVLPELPPLPDGSDAPEMPKLPPATNLPGHRVCCVKTYMSNKKMTVISSVAKVKAIAVFNTRGILFMETDDESGVIESYTWGDVLGFGATGEDCFGFETKDESEGFVCCYTAQSGHLMNLLSKKYSKMAEAGADVENFPKEYKP